MYGLISNEFAASPGMFWLAPVLVAVVNSQRACLIPFLFLCGCVSPPLSTVIFRPLTLFSLNSRLFAKWN